MHFIFMIPFFFSSQIPVLLVAECLIEIAELHYCPFTNKKIFQPSEKITSQVIPKLHASQRLFFIFTEL